MCNDHLVLYISFEQETKQAHEQKQILQRMTNYKSGSSFDVPLPEIGNLIVDVKKLYDVGGRIKNMNIHHSKITHNTTIHNAERWMEDMQTFALSSTQVHCQVSVILERMKLPRHLSFCAVSFNCSIEEDAVIRIISRMKTLESFHLFYCQIPMAPIYDAMKQDGMPRLHTLKLGQSNINLSNVELFANALEHLPNLKSLVFYQCAIGKLGFQKIMRAFRHTPKLRRVNIRKCDIEEVLPVELPPKYLKNMTHFYFFGNSLAPGMDTTPFSCFVGHMRRLKVLEVSNNIDPMLGNCNVQFMNMLAHLKELRVLNLKRERIHNLGIEHLCRALVCMPKLKHLKLSWNKFDDVGALRLARVLQNMFKLEQININCWDITHIGYQELLRSLIWIPTLNKKMQLFHLVGNSKRDIPFINTFMKCFSSVSPNPMRLRTFKRAHTWFRGMLTTTRLALMNAQVGSVYALPDEMVEMVCSQVCNVEPSCQSEFAWKFDYENTRDQMFGVETNE